MPLDLPPEVEAMIAAAAAGTEHYEYHTSLDIVFGDGAEIHIATADIDGVDTEEFGPIDYVSDLKSRGVLDQSMDLSVDDVDLTIQNVDGVIGGIALGTDNDALNGTLGILSTIFVNSDGNAFQVVELMGEIQTPDSQRLKGGFMCSLVSHLTSGGPIGGHRPLTKGCGAIYKVPRGRCNSTSTLPDCDYTVDGPNGCDKHSPAAALAPEEDDNTPRYQGFIHRIQPLAGAAISDPGGLIDGGNDFTSYYERQRSTGDYIGRMEIPLII